MAVAFVVRLSILAFALATLTTILAQNMSPMGGPPQGMPPPPPFLQGASPEKIEEFHQLLSSSGRLTDDQIEEKVKQWIEKQDEDIKTKFATYEQEKEKMEAAQEQAHQKAITKFSPKAKEADAKLTAIANNDDLAAQDKAKQIQDFMQSLPNEVREEIEKAMMQGGGGGGQQ